MSGGEKGENKTEAKFSLYTVYSMNIKHALNVHQLHRLNVQYASSTIHLEFEIYNPEAHYELVSTYTSSMLG